MATSASSPFQIRIVAPAAAAVLNDQWLRLDRPNSGGPPGFYFCPATSLPDGRIFQAWGATRLFTPATGMWVDQSVPVGLRENCAAAHDPVLNRVWITTGNPPGTSTAPPGEMYYNVASPSYTVVNQPSSTGTHDSAMEWHNGKLYRFGGFMGYDAQRLRSKNTNPESPWIQENDFDTMPDNTRYSGDQRQSLMTYIRGGVDRRTGQAWWLGANNELWLRADNGRWNVIPTFGPKPPQFSLAALNEDRNQIVTWCGKNQIAAGDPAGGGVGGGPDLGVTYVLNLGTLVWRQSRAAHSIPLSVMASHVLLYNRGRKKINLLAGDAVTTQVWEFTEAA